MMVCWLHSEILILTTRLTHIYYLLIAREKHKKSTGSYSKMKFDAPYEEEFLEKCEDGDAESKLPSLLDLATNLERTTEPFDKWASCAIV